jgi:hypothetical protein
MRSRLPSSLMCESFGQSKHSLPDRSADRLLHLPLQSSCCMAANWHFVPEGDIDPSFGAQV